MNSRMLLICTMVVILILLLFYPCDYSLSRCFFGNSILFFRTVFHICLSILSVSIFTFFISDRIFARWITFAIVWMIMAVSAIAISPIYSPYIFGGPTKESVSIWMGTLFVIISLTMFAVMTWRERRHKN